MRKAKCNRPLSVSFSEDIFDAIKEITDREQTSLADYIRSAVNQKLKQSSSTQSQNTTKE